MRSAMEDEARRARLVRLGLGFVIVVAALLTLAPIGQARPVRIPPPPAATASFTVTKYEPEVGTSGPVEAVSVLPGDDSVLAAAGKADGSGGLFLSDDGGSTWTHDDSFPAGDIQSIAWITAAGKRGWNCPCLLATAAPDFHTNNVGGLYEADHVFETHTWTRVGHIFPAVVPVTSSCPVAMQANDIAVAPDAPHDIYVATSCGLAIGTPRAGGAPTFVNRPVTGASDQNVESVTALVGGRVIVGGPTMGVWSYDPTTRWTQGTGLPSGGAAVDTIHAFAADPRDTAACSTDTQHCRAYAMTELSDRVALSETTDGGATWHRVNITVALFGANFRCGGIANVHAVEQSGRLALYAGDTCDTFVSTVALSQEPYSTLTTGDWTKLAEPHGDTWDLAFHSGTGLPYALASDGGVAMSTDGQTFQPVGPPQGFDSLQVPELAGQVPVGGLVPDLYFTTWHDSIWSMLGTSPRPATNVSGEGFGLGMPRRPVAGTENRVTVTGCDGCVNQIGMPHFTDEDAGHDALPRWNDAQANVGLPTFVSPRHYVQSAGATNAWSHTAGLLMTANDGSTWQQIADVADGLQGLAQVSGPVSSSTIIQPYYDSTDGALKLLSVGDVDASRGPASNPCGLSTPNCRFTPGMSGFGGLGVTPANTPSYAVYAVDPTDPNRIIAPDVVNGDFSRSTDGGATWNAIAGLKQLVTEDGVYRFAIGNQPNASVISICPEDDSRVLIGTRQGGAFFSFNGGDNWTHVDGSDPIQYATSIFWVPGCGSAYLSTFGRGIFRIDMSVRTAPLTQTPCAPPVCRLEQILGQRILKRHPLPSAAKGLIVSNGYITRIRSRKSTLIVDVTAGSALTPYRRLPARMRLVRVAAPARVPRVIVQAAFFIGHRVLRRLTGRHMLVLFPLAFGHRGRSAKPPQRPSMTIRVAGTPTVMTTPTVAVDGGQPLTVIGSFRQPAGSSLALVLDGRTVAKYAKGTKSFRFVGQPPMQMLPFLTLLGTHRFQLIGRTAGKRVVFGAASFTVPNSDGPADDVNSQPAKTALTLKCSATTALGGSLSASGTLSPALTGAAVAITYTGPKGVVSDQAITDAQAQFDDTTLATASGAWTIQATFAGDPLDAGSRSSSCVTTVTPTPLQPTALTLKCPSTLAVKSTLTVTGTLTSVIPGAPISVTFTTPSATTIVDAVFADGAGGYTAATSATSGGTWATQSSYPGDATHQASVSTPCLTTVS